MAASASTDRCNVRYLIKVCNYACKRKEKKPRNYQKIKKIRPFLLFGYEV
jgi:hypothetical protein